MRTPTVLVWLQTMAALAAGSSVASAQPAQSGETIRISRAAGPITVDGDLSDEGWRGATRVEKWYEANPGDNTEPNVRNVQCLTYDDRLLYAGFDLDDASLFRFRNSALDRDPE